MAYVIAEPSSTTWTGSASRSARVDCITADPANRKLFIDPGACIDCGSCETACPNEAVFRQDQLPRAWAAYARTDAAGYADPSAARHELDRLVSVR